MMIVQVRTLHQKALGSYGKQAVGEALCESGRRPIQSRSRSITRDHSANSQINVQGKALTKPTTTLNTAKAVSANNM